MQTSTYDTNNSGVVDSAESVDWNGITNKPLTFSPSIHDHLEKVNFNLQLTTARSGLDTNNIFTVITMKRSDLTVYKTSTLSGGTSPNYTTRTVVYYEQDGITVDSTFIYALEYSGLNLISETLI
jgi:hypothetical protein